MLLFPFYIWLTPSWNQRHDAVLKIRNTPLIPVYCYVLLYKSQYNLLHTTDMHASSCFVTFFDQYNILCDNTVDMKFRWWFYCKGVTCQLNHSAHDCNLGFDCIFVQQEYLQDGIPLRSLSPSQSRSVEVPAWWQELEGSHFHCVMTPPIFA